MSDITEEKTRLDKTETIGNSIIHHGKFNNRIYLLNLGHNEAASIIPKLDDLAAENGYTKIFAKIHSDALPEFMLNGYEIEAFVPEFYVGNADCIMVAKFLDDERRRIPIEKVERFNELLNSFSYTEDDAGRELGKYRHAVLSHADVKPVTEVFKRVFETYPFPVHDAGYISENMEGDDSRYYGIWDGGDLMGISTAEIDILNKNAEMTDFAVLPEFRGRGLALKLLYFMEKEMKAAGVKTVYTIARLGELGMNKTFLKAGYKYTGTLVKNTNIGGSIESMNIYYKRL
ncbi:MAG: putative beta-lysine N-acetyltransferase [Tangfeifania sp.]